MTRASGVRDWLADVWAKNVAPTERLTITEWADKYRVLPSEACAEPGPWRTERVPYLAEVMDCLSSNSPIRKVVVMKGSQLGFTEALNNFVGAAIDLDPGPILSIMPTLAMAERNVRTRIEPMCESTPRLSAKLPPRKSRSGDNTLMFKKFPGGFFATVGSNSASGLRSSSIRYLLMDEADAMEQNVEGEGDPMLLAERRATTYANHKIALVSTPKIAGISRVERAYLESDQRRYYVPCPFCGAFQTLEFGNLVPLSPSDVRYRCSGCKDLFHESAKDRILGQGKWRATAVGKDPTVAGFQISSLYAPVGWEPWHKLVADYARALEDPNAMATFVNCSLGLPLAQEMDAPAWEALHARAESYAVGTVPDGVFFLVAGVDVQRDRLELQLVGYGRGKESWVLDYQVFMGDVATKEPWQQLTTYLNREFPCAGEREGRTMAIRVLAIDSGAYSPQVYAWARDWAQPNYGPAGANAPHQRTVAVVKGQASDKSALTTVSKADGVASFGQRRWVRIQSLGTPVIKSHLYSLLKLRRKAGEAPPAGYIHFPALGEKYFEGLTAERLVSYTERGYQKTRWELPPGKRNEALDTWVYAYAAALIVGLDRFGDDDWKKFEDLPPIMLQSDETPTIIAPRAAAPSQPAKVADEYASVW